MPDTQPAVTLAEYTEPIAFVPTAERPRCVYVASSWRNRDQPAIVAAIRAAGIETYDFRNPEGVAGFAWSFIDPLWQQWPAEDYLAALEHPLAVAGFNSDFEAMQSADTVVLVLPCGRSAHLELGWAVGAGKRTAILLNGDNEPELMVKMVDHIATDLADLLEWIHGARTCRQCGCTNDRACEGGCRWAPDDGLGPRCSTCEQAGDRA